MNNQNIFINCFNLFCEQDLNQKFETNNVFKNKKKRIILLLKKILFLSKIKTSENQLASIKIILSKVLDNKNYNLPYILNIKNKVNNTSSCVSFWWQIETVTLDKILQIDVHRSGKIDLYFMYIKNYKIIDHIDLTKQSPKKITKTLLKCLDKYHQ